MSDFPKPAALTPRMARILDNIRRARRPPFHTMSPEQAREVYDAGAELLEPPRAKLPRVEDIDIPADDGMKLPARLYVPQLQDAPLPALLYLHGGGCVIGSLDSHDSLCRQLALRSGGAVVSLAYRLAPEHPFPAAVNDSWAALRWLASDRGAALGIDPRVIAVGGDSAGGSLSAVCALLARDAGLPLALQLLITPGTSGDDTWPSRRTYAQGYLLEQSGIDWFFDQYLARELRNDWRFAPLLADDMSGVAPTCLILAECDPLVDEGLAYGDRLRAAGVPVELALYRGLTHDFIKMGRMLEEAGQAQAVAAAALRHAWDGATPLW